MTEAHPLRCDGVTSCRWCRFSHHMVNEDRFYCNEGFPRHPEKVFEIPKSVINAGGISTLCPLPICDSSAKSDALEEYMTCKDWDELETLIRNREQIERESANPFNTLITNTRYFSFSSALCWVLDEIKIIRSQQKER